MQTSEDPIHPNMVKELKKYYGYDWEYYHYNGQGRIDFIRDNPLEEFPNMIELFDGIPGASKADLFRYYFLYVKGGVYIDSDALLKTNIDSIINDYPCDFFVPIPEGTVTAFNGFLGCSQNSKVMHEVLKNAYNTSKETLNAQYFALCHNLFNIVHNNTTDEKIHLFKEVMLSWDIGKTIDHNNKEILLHYWHSKVPKELL